MYRIAEPHLKTDHGQLITEHFRGPKKKRFNSPKTTLDEPSVVG
jgi:hypothetical protein